MTGGIGKKETTKKRMIAKSVEAPSEANSSEATSSEARHDWLADRWVIVASGRDDRPQDFVAHNQVVSNPSECPFCAGNEAETPEPQATYPSGSGEDWQVRVVPNKYPALQSEAASLRYVGGGDADLFHRRTLTGAHEVVVESPKHIQSISELDLNATRLVFEAYRDRLSYWIRERNFAYAVAFKNVGSDAGASLYHSHSQIMATDLLPTEIARHAGRMQSFLDLKGRCLFCSMLQEEIEHGVRIVEETPGFVAFCPFASRLPGMMTILPKQHDSCMHHLVTGKLEELAWLSHRSIRRLEKVFPTASYNYLIHTSPRDHQGTEHMHWRVELFPRLVKVAGFEWGSDCFINPLPPEKAAMALRSAGDKL